MCVGVTPAILDIPRQKLIGAPASIKEIALRVGIKDQLYFSRLFRKATCMSPAKYRQSRAGKFLMISAIKHPTYAIYISTDVIW
jgi:AraC-like DNA-binding protein